MLLCIVYWFYYRWSPHSTYIYTHLWFQVLFYLETCFRDNRTRSELAHFYIFIAQGVWCDAGKIFFRKILFRHQFIWNCAKEISGEKYFFRHISVIYQDKIRRVDYYIIDVIFSCFLASLNINKRFYGLCLWAS